MMFDKEKDGMEDFLYGATVAQSHVSIRLGFLRKVYGILSSQLALTAIVGCLTMLFQDAVRSFLVSNPWILIVSLLLNFVSLIGMYVYRKTTPHNFVLLFIFTLVESITVGFVIVHYDVMAVLISLILTLVVSISLTIYTFQSKRDFSSLGAGLFAGLIVLFCGGMLQFFIGSSKLEMLLAIGGAFLFSLLIIYDTWKAIHRLSAEEYILACVDLYLDIINLFLHILRIIGSSRQN